MARRATFNRTTITTAPETPPLTFACPQCGARLLYRHTVISGVPPPERWDLYDCGRCGEFEYRHRGRRLRFIDGEGPQRPCLRRNLEERAAARQRRKR